MKALNLTASQRADVRVTFSVNKFVATCAESEFLIGAYASKSALKADLALNGITGARFDGIAQRQDLANYGG